MTSPQMSGEATNPLENSVAAAPLRLAFIHIPKTGGNSVGAMLQSCFPREQIAPFIYEHLNPDLPDESYRFVQGHFGFTYAKQLKAQVLTVLRDPIDRVISTYYFLKSGNKHPIVPTLSFEEFLLSDVPSIVAQIDNAQTWQLAHGSLVKQRKQLAALSDSEVLAQAERNLRSCFVVGVTERLDAFASNVSAKLGLSLPSQTRKNKTKERPAVDDVPVRLREIIESRTCLDRRLYEIAQELAADRA